MSPWALLGIARTADAAAIRRAYARKLKLTRPDEDPEGFQRLVQARDAALREAAMIANFSLEDDGQDETKHDANPMDDASVNPGHAMGAAETDVPPIVIREVSEPDPKLDSEPLPRIVVTDEDGDTEEPLSPATYQDGFVLEASDQHWDDARRFAKILRLILSRAPTPANELARWLDWCKAMPRGPRQEAEASLIEATGRDLRLPDGRFNSVAVENVRALFRHGEPVFGWLRDDTLIHKMLGARDAAAFCLIGREEDDWNSDRRPRIPDSDARVMFAGTRKCMRAFERFRRRGRPAWHFDAVCFLVPMLWAYYYRQAALAFAMIAALTAAGILMMAAEGLSDESNLAGAGIFLAIPLATALLSDRLILWAAARTVRRARRDLCYDPKLRTDFLRREGQPRDFISLLVFALFSSAFLTVAYVAAYIRLEQAATALLAFMGW